LGPLHNRTCTDYTLTAFSAENLRQVLVGRIAFAAGPHCKDIRAWSFENADDVIRESRKGVVRKRNERAELNDGVCTICVLVVSIVYIGHDSTRKMFYRNQPSGI
jgi:hypothetical protein